MFHRLVRAMLLVVTALVTVPPAGAEPVRFVQTPEVSPDGTRIAFSYAGDIWTVPVAGGKATRITDHVAYDGTPVWSPDGTMIAFSSDRRGNGDVFVIGAGGGEPKQLTHHSNTDTPRDWTPDGRILFETRRGGSEDLWVIDATGGMPIQISYVYNERESFANLSPDGKKLLYNDNRSVSGWRRRFFESSDAADIHIADFSLKGIRPQPLVEGDFHDLWPHFSPDGKTVYFVSGRAGRLNVFSVPAAGGESRAITNFDDDVTWLSVAERGNVMVYSAFFDVWVHTLGAPEGKKITIDCATESKENTVSYKTFGKDVSEFRVSPDGKKIALVVQGEIFVVPAKDGGQARRMTMTPWRERDVRWLSDSRTIVYSSDRSGNLDLFKCDTKTGTESVLIATSENESKPNPSPTDDVIAYYHGNNTIKTIDADGRNVKERIKGDFLDLRLQSDDNFSWSPDGKWIAYTQYAKDFHTDIRVRELASGRDEAISWLSRSNQRPVWSPDGEYIYFTSSFDDDIDTYRVRLKDEKLTFDEDVLDSLYDEPADDEEDAKDKKKDKKKEEEAKPVVIDFNRIDLRMAAYPGIAANEFDPVFTESGHMVFSANVLDGYDLWAYPTGDEKDKELVQLTTSEKSKGSVYADGNVVWYEEGGKIHSVDVEKGAKSRESVSFDAEMEVDQVALWKQMFLEGWSLLDDQFYDPEYHGASWDKVRLKYEALLPFATTTKDYQELMLLMVGELGASHLNFSSPSSQNDFTGDLGVRLDFPRMVDDGAFRVASVVPNSPADRDDARIEAGEFLIAIDGVKLVPGTNLYSLLERKVGKRVEVEVAANASGRGSRVVRIKPVTRNTIIGLRYEEWVQERRDMVDEWSDGKLAYLHIRSMGAGALRRFYRELVTMADGRDGAILDVRYNGGGYTAVHILGILERKPFLLRNFRGLPLTSETKMRSYGYEKPTALLINNHSYSNAEILAEGFRKLGLGPIVGIPTAGSVIGTSNLRLMDGSTFRKPSWGAFTLEGENLENNGRKPDFHVENRYNDWVSGADPQLEKAVEELLKAF